ncbi:Fungal specific transcription factor domain-containing protein 7 [Elsinoe fawcettii]|nr:Fungal specific transcription factor domain-containing protein 7 [Elsinoe fawcettii]
MPLSEDISIFAFGDAPLPKTDESFLRLPTISEARQLIRTYFDVAFPTHRFLHEPTVEGWMHELYQHAPAASVKPGSRERAAIVLLVLAHALLYSRKTNPDRDIALDSANLFAASEHQLGRETGEVRLSAVQARLGQCFYLLANSRVNQCWNLFGTTARLALAVGIHRKQKLIARHTGHFKVDHECRKRTLWAAYSLDNYLSAALGRPRALHDQDIDQDFPEAIDDHDLTEQSSDQIPEPSNGGQSVMLAPIYHARLSRIISSILTAQYGIIRPSWDKHATLAKAHLEKIADWRLEIQSFLDAQWTSIGLMIPPFSRQCTVLNLASCYTTILTTRPLLLCGRQAIQSCPPAVRDKIRESRLAGLDAALRIIKIVRVLCDGNKMFEAFWFTYYYTFTALTVLYVFIIEHRNERSEDWQAHLADAEACLSSLSQTVPSSSFAARYGVVLEELRTEASRRLSGQQNNQPLQVPAQLGAGDAVAPGSVAVDLDMFSIGNMQDFDNTSPSSFLAGVSGWADIETLLNPTLPLNADWMTDWSM